MGRVERQTIQVAIESVYDLHMHAGLCVAFTTGKMYGGTSLVCRRWCDYSNKKIYFCIIYFKYTHYKKKKQSCRYQRAPYAPQTICYDSFYSRSGLPYLVMNLPALY